MKIIIALFGVYLLLYIIALMFGTNVTTLLIVMSLFIGVVFLIHKIGITAFFSIIGVIILIGLLWLLWDSRVRKKNLIRPLINKEYGRCKDCMSPDISLVKKENVVTGYQYQKLDGTPDYRYKNNQPYYKMVFYYKCNDCSLGFTNFERDRAD